MRENLTHSTEDYLKIIYSLSDQFGRATTNQLAERLGVTPASVTGMVQKMAEARPPLLVYHKHQGVVLTPEGERAALEVIRHHRLLELFLQHSLGYTWDEVHTEADRLEHVISEEMEERIAQVLGDPIQDPHGEPIPSRELELPPRSDTRLSELRGGQVANVERVIATDPELLRYLSDLGMVPGARIQVLDYSPYDENLRLLVDDHRDPLVLGEQITRQIFVDRK